jgi:hypothetical protein
MVTPEVERLTDLENDQSIQRWRDAVTGLDDAIHGAFEPPYIPSRGRSTLEREYNALIERSETRICKMLVSAQVDRLRVTGVRAGLSDEDQELASLAWGWMLASRLDRRQSLLYRDAGSYGDGFVLVTDGPKRIPLLTIESPLNLYPRLDLANPERYSEVAKVVDDLAWLYTPDEIISFKRKSVVSQWQVIKSVPHRAGECPIVRFPNDLDSSGRSFSEIEPVLPIQARLHQGLFDRLLTQRNTSWRQRWGTGIEMDRDDEGNVKGPPFEVGPDTFLMSENPEARFGEFLQASLDPLLKAIDADLAAAAMVTRTPPTFLPQNSISSVSAEALVALEAAFAAKIGERQALASEGYERMFTIAARVADVDLPDTLGVVWADLEMRSQAQRADAALKARSMGLPIELALEIMGYSDARIDEIKQQAEREQEARARAEALALGIGGNPANIDYSLADPSDSAG